MSLVYLHNPSCSKSRQGLELIKESGLDVEIREYLIDLLSPAELEDIFEKLEDQIDQIVRTKEDLYKDLLAVGEWPQNEGHSALALALAEHPKLLERPILFSESRAIIGRPTENLRALLTT